MLAFRHVRRGEESSAVARRYLDRVARSRANEPRPSNSKSSDRRRRSRGCTPGSSFPTHAAARWRWSNGLPRGVGRRRRQTCASSRRRSLRRAGPKRGIPGSRGCAEGGVRGSSEKECRLRPRETRTPRERRPRSQSHPALSSAVHAAGASSLGEHYGSSSRMIGTVVAGVQALQQSEKSMCGANSVSHKQRVDIQ